MSILDRLESDMKAAAKARESERLGVIRFIRSQTQNRRIELGRDLKDEDVIEVLARLAKQHRESIEQFSEGGRNELVEQEKRKLAVVEQYLPAQLSAAELEDMVSRAIAETGASGPRDMGAVMKTLMPGVKGRADGKAVKELVQKRLTGGE